MLGKDKELCRKAAGKVVVTGIYLYLVLPFIIFAIGWLKTYLAIPVVLLVVCATWKAVRDTKNDFWLPELTWDNIVRFLCISALIGIWVYYSGIGKHVWQNPDHTCRNAIFDALVKHEWPVYNMQDAKGSGRALIYYIGFWLPSAVVGKLFGLHAGYTFQMIWAVFGIWIVYYFICAGRKKLELWPLAILVFFSGLDYFGCYLVQTDFSTLTNDAHLEQWTHGLQYSSMTTQLFWVFNQAIPAWMCTALARAQKDNRSLVFIFSTCLLSATFPTVGLLILALYWGMSREIRLLHEARGKGEKAGACLRQFLKNVMTFQNVFGGGAIGLISFFYLRSNGSAERMTQHAPLFGAVPWVKYFVFILLEAGLYLIVVYKYYRQNGEYYVIALSLLCIPLLVNLPADWCMRVSIPALFVLMLYVIETLPQMYRSRDWGVLLLLILLLTGGAITPMHEMTRAVKQTIICIDNGSDIAPTIPFEQLMQGDNFSGEVENNFFFEHLVK